MSDTRRANSLALARIEHLSLDLRLEAVKADIDAQPSRGGTRLEQSTRC